MFLNSLGYQDADTGAYTSLIIETTAASLAGAAICVGSDLGSLPSLDLREIWVSK